MRAFNSLFIPYFMMLLEVEEVLHNWPSRDYTCRPTHHTKRLTKKGQKGKKNSKLLKSSFFFQLQKMLMDS